MNGNLWAQLNTSVHYTGCIHVVQIEILNPQAGLIFFSIQKEAYIIPNYPTKGGVHLPRLVWQESGDQGYIRSRTSELGLALKNTKTISDKELAWIFNYTVFPFRIIPDNLTVSWQFTIQQVVARIRNHLGSYSPPVSCRRLNDQARRGHRGVLTCVHLQITLVA